MTSEEIARAVARGSQPTPVHPFELPVAAPKAEAPSDEDRGDFEADDPMDEGRF